jgi:hypothetical protein
MWLDKNGKINWISNINQSIYQKYKGTDLSYRPYFYVPRDTHTEYYSSLIESNDKVPRLYIVVILLDEADFFPPGQQQDARDVSERYIAKSNPYIAMVSTTNAPDGLFERIDILSLQQDISGLYLRHW